MQCTKKKENRKTIFAYIQLGVLVEVLLPVPDRYTQFLKIFVRQLKEVCACDFVS